MKENQAQLKSYRIGNKVKWIPSGKAFFDELFKIIDNAKETLHVQFYIFEEDEIGKETIHLLMKAAKRGVKVFVVVDAFGSIGLSDYKEAEMKNAGINFRRFARFVGNRFLYFGRRLHHKIIVADENIALVGGINIANKYLGTKNKPAWVDYAILVEGNIANDLTKVCSRIWLKRFKSSLRLRRKRLTGANEIKKGISLARVRENDWLRGKKGITNSHRHSFRLAENSINIVGGYFIPGTRFRNLLRKASQRGVKINIILTDISDVAFVKNATRYLYSWMLRNGIRFYEIKNRMLHGKVVVVDNLWTTIGSYNMDDLSLYNNIECNIDVIDEDFAIDFNKHFFDVIEHQCVEITHENYERSTNVFNKFYDWMSYQIVRTSAKILLFFTHKIEKDEE